MVNTTALAARDRARQNTDDRLVEGRILRLRRTALPSSQAVLAHRAGVNPKTVSNYEEGSCKPQPMKLTAIEQALDDAEDMMRLQGPLTLRESAVLDLRAATLLCLRRGLHPDEVRLEITRMLTRRERGDI